MNPNVKSHADRLAEALAESEEYQAVKEAREELEQHEAAKIMLRDFQQKQAAVQRKVLSGQNPTEQEVQKLQEAYQIVVVNPYVRKLIEAEAAFSEMLAEVQRILAEAVGLEVPDDPAAGAQGAEPAGSPSVHGSGGEDRDDDSSTGRGRLWVPGR